MRPLYLKMTAFGSYAEATELPFKDLRHGLYLVCGDTGAGKTTIFDAIMFALYGVASGSDRKSDMLHCDYVPKSVDTEVELHFSHLGKEYRVLRKIHFSKKRGADGQYNDGVLSASLTEPDRETTEGSSKVTARCEEILGLNAEQFRKIIMLAQGEFREFLKADSDKKNEILGNIFDNAPYVYFQNLFLGARDALKAQRSGYEAALRTQMDSVFILPDDHEEDREAFLPGHPNLVENLVQLTERETKEFNQLDSVRTGLHQEVEQLNTEKGAAETFNSLFETLKIRQEDLKKLELLDNAMAQRKTALERIETAFRKTKPAIDSRDQAYTELNATLTAIGQLNRQLAECEQAVASAKDQVDRDAETNTELDRIKTRIDDIKKQLPQYQELEKLQQQKKEADDAVQKARDSKTQKESLLSESKEKIRDLKDRLDALSQVDVEEQRCKNAADKASERLVELTGVKGICKDISDIRGREKHHKNEEENLRVLTNQAFNAKEEYSSCYDLFISAQAGLLAEKLRAEFETKETAVCPVCGSEVCRTHIPQFAELPAETPSQSKVDNAKKVFEDLEKARSKKYTSVNTEAGEIGILKTAALNRMQRVVEDCESWEMLNDDVYFSAVSVEAESIARKTAAALQEAKARRGERDLVHQQLQEKEQEREKTEKELVALREEEQAQNETSVRLSSQIQEKASHLTCKDESSAEAEKKALEEKRDKLSELLEKHRQALQEAKGNRDTCIGSLKEKKDASENQKLAYERSRDEASRILAETGFSGVEEVDDVLSAIGEDGDSWLKREADALTDHVNAKKNLRDQIKTLQDQTSGKQSVDLADLKQQLSLKNEEYQRVNEKCNLLNSWLTNHRNVLSEIRAIKTSLKNTDGAWKRLDRLAALAGGVNSEGGKLSFDRYVMGAIFREILEMANRRMELMSGGRYELVHKTSADRRNAKAGLDIEVLDNNTGMQRASTSLSGGEGFFTSLSLALGLSDVVQNHAGGKQMDSLFIDEGFGSLSADVLDKALEVLSQLTEGSRLVGIISHVDKLDESIPQKIRVSTGEKGSSLKLE